MLRLKILNGYSFFYSYFFIFFLVNRKFLSMPLILIFIKTAFCPFYLFDRISFPRKINQLCSFNESSRGFDCLFCSFLLRIFYECGLGNLNCCCYIFVAMRFPTNFSIKFCNFYFKIDKFIIRHKSVNAFQILLKNL